MTILLENLKVAMLLDNISESDALYIIHVHNNMVYPIKPKALLRLTKLKFIIGGRVGKRLYETSVTAGTAGVKLTGKVKPIYDTAVSREVVIRLARLLCVIDPKTQLPKLPGVTGKDNEMQYTAKHYLQGEGLLAFHYITFLYMFPAKGGNNKKWEKHFLGFPYNGMRLRFRTKSSGGKFLRIAKNKDMGAFLYGTYLYIQSAVVENKTFIKSVTNYLAEYDDWYYEALEILQKAKTVDELFKKNTLAKEGRNRTAL